MSFVDFMDSPYSDNECAINGKRIKYDGMSSFPLEEAKNYYEKLGYEYIGSSYITYHNGTKNTWNKLNHFFIKKTTNTDGKE
jgi:hypothetical protein